MERELARNLLKIDIFLSNKLPLRPLLIIISYEIFTRGGIVYVFSVPLTLDFMQTISTGMDEAIEPMDELTLSKNLVTPEGKTSFMFFADHCMLGVHSVGFRSLSMFGLVHSGLLLVVHW